jgi:hypothetical protein
MVTAVTSAHSRALLPHTLISRFADHLRHYRRQTNKACSSAHKCFVFR